MLDEAKEFRAKFLNIGFVQNFFVEKLDDRNLTDFCDVDSTMNLGSGTFVFVVLSRGKFSVS